MFYIEFLNAKNNFRPTKKEFESFEDAKKWGQQNLDNFNIDMIKIK